MDISKLSTQELEQLAYRQMKQRDATIANLQVIELELQKRQVAEQALPQAPPEPANPAQPATPALDQIQPTPAA